MVKCGNNECEWNTIRNKSLLDNGETTVRRFSRISIVSRYRQEFRRWLILALSKLWQPCETPSPTQSVINYWLQFQICSSINSFRRLTPIKTIRNSFGTVVFHDRLTAISDNRPTSKRTHNKPQETYYYKNKYGSCTVNSELCISYFRVSVPIFRNRFY